MICSAHRLGRLLDKTLGPNEADNSAGAPKRQTPLPKVHNPLVAIPKAGVPRRAAPPHSGPPGLGQGCCHPTETRNRFECPVTQIRKTGPGAGPLGTFGYRSFELVSSLPGQGVIPAKAGIEIRASSFLVLDCPSHVGRAGAGPREVRIKSDEWPRGHSSIDDAWASGCRVLLAGRDSSHGLQPGYRRSLLFFRHNGPARVPTQACSRYPQALLAPLLDPYALPPRNRSNRRPGHFAYCRFAEIFSILPNLPTRFEKPRRDAGRDPGHASQGRVSNPPPFSENLSFALGSACRPEALSQPRQLELASR
jgi:hypothetical protein